MARRRKGSLKRPSSQQSSQQDEAQAAKLQQQHKNTTPAIKTPESPRTLRRPSRNLQEGKFNEEPSSLPRDQIPRLKTAASVTTKKATPGSVLNSVAVSSKEKANAELRNSVFCPPEEDLFHRRQKKEADSSNLDLPSTMRETTPQFSEKFQITDENISTRSNQCWVCQVPLKFPNRPDMVCWYATHQHPHFPGLPVCAVCAKEQSMDNDDICVGCFQCADTTHVLCDSCPNEYCTDCLAPFYNVERLLADEDAEWKCPECCPVLPPLEIEDENLDDLLDRLYYAELEHEQCDGDTDHEYRVADCISQVLELIWNQHEISSEKVYKSLLPDLYNWSPSKQPMADSVLAQANAEIDRRHAEVRGTMQEDVDEYDTTECYDDVEDLGAMDEEDEKHLSLSVLKKGGWAGIRRPRPLEIDMAMANESKLNIRVKAAFQEQDDKQRIDGDEDDKIVAKPKRARPQNSLEDQLWKQTSTIKRQKRSTPIKRNEGTTQRMVDIAHTATDVVDSLPLPAMVPASKVVPVLPKVFEGDLRSSDFVLCDTPVRRVSIDPEIAKHLKPHQVEAAQFIWNNCFADFGTKKDGDKVWTSKGESAKPDADSPTIGGCVLAHAMGLGKSLSSISVIHAIMTSPSLNGSSGKRLISRALLVAPVNTIANWENEWKLWQNEVTHKVNVYNISNFHTKIRTSQVLFWMDNGGVLLVSDGTFKTLRKECEMQPDVVVLDEAHTMLKNSQTQIYKCLQSIRTPRRIGMIPDLQSL